MNLLLILLLCLAGLVALPFLLGLFAPKSYSVERSVVINRSTGEVYDYLRHLKNQDHFSKWVMRDPNMKKMYRGDDGTVGFVYEWEGNKQAGKGEQEIKSLEPGKRIDAEVRFEKPFKAVAQTPFTIEQTETGQSKVTWEMQSAMNYPMNSMLLIINMNKLLGKDMEFSLGNLQRILESH